MSLRSPRSPKARGFVPLGTQRSHDAEVEIPLSNVPSRIAESTKSRKADFKSVEMESEKPVRGGRRRIKKDLVRADTGGTEEMSLNAMGRIYKKIIGFSVITRYLFYVAPMAILLAAPLVILPLTGNRDRPRLDQNEVHGPSLFMLFLWIEVAWLSLWAGKIVAHLLPAVFMFFCGVVSSGTRKYATVLRALEIYLSLFFWALASYLFFRFLIPERSVHWVDIVTKILLALFVSAAVLVGEKAIVQLISITYHQRSFANRIKESKHEIYLLGLLYDASRTLFPMYCPEFAEEDYIINDSIEMMLGGKRGHRRAGSVTPMRLIGDIGRVGDKITSVFGNVASEITGMRVFNPNSAHSIVVEALEKLRSSEAMARRIWMSFAVEGKDTLSAEDITEVLGPAHKEEAEECFAAIDGDQNGDISLDEMIRKVVEIGQERKAIANSMKDIGQALAVFDKVLGCVVLLIVLIIFLFVFQSSFLATLTTAGTTLLSLSFVFAVTTQEFLGSCIFLFVKHPFDVGDRVDISGPEKEQLLVEKISLLYTVFTRIDKNQVVQVPNIKLNDVWIENVTRSKAMREMIEVNVSFDTPLEDIELLRLEMEKFVRSPENNRDFQSDLAIGIGAVNDLDKLTLKIGIKHKSNWHNDAVRASRRSKFVCALALALKRVPINGPGGGGDALGGPLNPQYNVAVSDSFAAAVRANSEKEKEAARLANQTLSQQNSHKAQQEVEERAAIEINTRNPLAGATDDWGFDEGPGDPTSTSALFPRASSRGGGGGLRRAGDALPATPLTEVQPGPHPTSAWAPPFDVERQAGTYDPTNPGPSLFPSHSGAQSNNPYAAYSTMPMAGGSDHDGHGLQPGGAGPTTGSRPRGASIANTQGNVRDGKGTFAPR